MKMLNGPTAAPRSRVLIIGAVGAALVLLGLWQTNEPPDAEAFDTAGAAFTSRAAAIDPQLAVSSGYAFARRTALKVSNDLFAAQSWYVAPPPPPPRPAVVVAPSAPPLPFAFLGSYARGADKPVFFLTRGEVVLDVRAGDSIDNVYRVEGVENGSLVFTYQPLKQRQSLFVGN